MCIYIYVYRTLWIEELEQRSLFVSRAAEKKKTVDEKN